MITLPTIQFLMGAAPPGVSPFFFQGEIRKTMENGHFPVDPRLVVTFFRIAAARLWCGFIEIVG